jgi:hypothetical protein
MQSGDHRGTPGLSKDRDHRKFFKNTQTLPQASPNYLKIVENISSKQLFSINKSMFKKFLVKCKGPQTGDTLGLAKV